MGAIVNKPELFKFAFFPTYKESIAYLADKLADSEDWDFSNSHGKQYGILKTYLEFTFRRLQHEKKIVFTSNNECACFNTGLVTENLEDIYAYFESYKKIEGKGFPEVAYCFRAFLKKSDNTILKHFSHNLPDVANYFEKPDLLIFNPKFELIPNIEHIISDNIARFPAHMRELDKSELNRRLFGSIDEAKKKARINYKIAVPQFYENRIQLLLPLCLTPGSPNPDLALVVQQISDKTYSSRTCLTLRMAYNNARLIVKPQSNWLKP